VRRDRVERALAGDPAPYDLVFADPPYALADDELARVLHRLTEGWLAPGAVLVVERSSRGAGPRWPQGVEALKQRRYGEGTLWYGRFS
jgi:16S rRNA (guanine966-N2)-methyltransferase